MPWAEKMLPVVKCLSPEQENLSWISGTREMALMVKCLKEGNEDPNSIPDSHIKSQVWYPVPVIPVLGRQKDESSMCSGVVISSSFLPSIYKCSFSKEFLCTYNVLLWILGNNGGQNLKNLSSCGSHQPTRVMPMKSSVENFIIQKKSDTGNSPVSATALTDDSHSLHDSKTMVSRKSKAFMDPGKP